VAFSVKYVINVKMDEFGLLAEQGSGFLAVNQNHVD
jgi:hypothetical protein